MNGLRTSPAGPILCLSLLVAVTDNALASQLAVPDALMECTLQTDDLARLTCFDREIARLAPAVESAPANTATEPQATADTEVAAADTEVAAADDEFGMTAELASKASGGEADDKPKELTGVVVALRKRPYGEHVVTLNNGQVWAQKRAESGFRLKVGDTATIRRGAFGSYRLVGQGKRSFEVKRIE